MTTITLKAGQKPTKEEFARAAREYEEALKHEPVFDDDSPESTAKALSEFAAMSRELKRKHRSVKRPVSVRLTSECIEQYKALGKGYTGLMADVLSFAAKDPNILRKVISRGARRRPPKTPQERIV